MERKIAARFGPVLRRRAPALSRKDAAEDEEQSPRRARSPASATLNDVGKVEPRAPRPIADAGNRLRYAPKSARSSAFPSAPPSDRPEPHRPSSARSSSATSHTPMMPDGRGRAPCRPATQRPIALPCWKQPVARCRDPTRKTDRGRAKTRPGSLPRQAASVSRMIELAQLVERGPVVAASATPSHGRWSAPRSPDAAAFFRAICFLEDRGLPCPSPPAPGSFASPRATSLLHPALTSASAPAKRSSPRSHETKLHRFSGLAVEIAREIEDEHLEERRPVVEGRPAGRSSPQPSCTRPPISARTA